MDNDKDKLPAHENDNVSDAAADADSIEIGPGGILAGSITAGNPASNIVGGLGSLGGGPVGSVAASEETDEDPAQDSQLNLDALDALDDFGSDQRDTGDDGVNQS